MVAALGGTCLNGALQRSGKKGERVGEDNYSFWDGTTWTHMGPVVK